MRKKNGNWTIFNYKKRNKYSLFDTLQLMFENMHSSCMQDIRVSNKTKRVYSVISFEVKDDWYADTGAITHYEKVEHYMGTLVYSSDNIEEAAIKFNELINKKGKI